MSKTQIIVFGIFFPILFCSIGSLFFIKGYQFFKTKKSKKEKCQMQTTGIIKDVSAMRMDNSSAYFYTYEYMINNQRYQVKTNFGTTRRQFNKGESIIIYYDINNPSLSYIKGYKEDSLAAFGSLIAGSIVLLIGIFVFLFVIFSK